MKQQQAYIRPFMQQAALLPPSYPYNPSQNNYVLIEEGQDLHNLYKCPKTAKNDLEFERRIFQALKSFIESYIVPSQKKLISDIKEKTLRLRREAIGSKGVRQCAGVVVFMAIKQDLGISLRQFCKRNKLNLKLTNKHAKAYYKLYHHNEVQYTDNSALNESSASIKLQYKAQQLLQLQDSIKCGIILQEEEPEYIIIQNDWSSRKAKQQQQCRKAINLIFSDLFKGQYFHQNRAILIENLIANIVPIDQAYKQIAVAQESLIYYLIFAAIKHHKYRVSFSQFRQIVRKKAAESVNKKQAEQINQMYTIRKVNRTAMESSLEDLSSEGSQLLKVGNVKEEEFYWQARSFKMVESPVVMQQQYFSFENCYFFPAESHSYE